LLQSVPPGCPQAMAIPPLSADRKQQLAQSFGSVANIESIINYYTSLPVYVIVYITYSYMNRTPFPMLHVEPEQPSNMEVVPIVLHDEIELPSVEEIIPEYRVVSIIDRKYFDGDNGDTVKWRIQWSGILIIIYV
jgi:hypothetical protein